MKSILLGLLLLGTLARPMEEPNASVEVGAPAAHVIYPTYTATAAQCDTWEWKADNWHAATLGAGALTAAGAILAGILAVALGKRNGSIAMGAVTLTLSVTTTIGSYKADTYRQRYQARCMAQLLMQGPNAEASFPPKG